MGRVVATLVSSLLIVLPCLSEARAADAPEVRGWRIQRYDEPHDCIAFQPISGPPNLEFNVDGPQYRLFTDLPPNVVIQTGRADVSVSFDHGPKTFMHVVGEESGYQIPIDHDFGMRLRSASALTVTIGDITYKFDVRQVDEVMDALAGCANVPPFVKIVAHAPVSIAGGSDWKIVDNPLYIDRCAIEKKGPQIDTLITRNYMGLVVLAAVRMDWSLPSQSLAATLQFDDSPPHRVDAGEGDDLVSAWMINARQEHELAQAKKVRWHLPWGDYQADLNGVGIALDALAACDEKKSVGSSH